jgi:hypothetical protein
VKTFHRSRISRATRPLPAAAIPSNRFRFRNTPRRSLRPAQRPAVASLP